MEFVSYDIESMDFRRAGAASRNLKERLKLIGAEAEAIRRTMIAAYEAEMNVVIHSVGGRLEASLTDSQVDVNVVDTGPGIADIEQAMAEGFSTANAEARALGFGAGMGLPNIKKNSDRLRLTSHVGEGTRVSFTVRLRPGLTDGANPISLYASTDRCRDCRACLAACPTRAMRVRDGRPSVLEHLCVDCAECISACTSRALGMREEITSLGDLPERGDMLLVVPPALLAGCGADYPPAHVLAALRELGFADVLTTEPHELALRTAVAHTATAAATAAASDAATETAPRPVIAPSCPAAVALVELRFPSLVPHLAPFDSPWEAAQAACAGQPATFVVSCPSQRSALLAHAAAVPPAGAPHTEYVAPEVIREAVMARLAGGSAPTPAATRGAQATKPAPAAPAAPTAPTGEEGSEVLLTVTGAGHVAAVLEQIEDGLLSDVNAVDPYMCAGGCFGSPLLFEDHHVAALRWARDPAAVDRTGKPGAVPRRRPFAARPGIRLDANMGRAIEKLGRLQAVIDSLPGKDCGVCGAPTCAALAEDVVMERATVALCPYAQSGTKEDGDR